MRGPALSNGRMLLASSLFFLVFLLACQPPLEGNGIKEAPSPIPTFGPKGSAECPRLDSQLLQLARATDPQGYAASAGLQMEGDAVRVVVELAGDTLPATKYLRVEKRYGNLVQGLAPVELLCELSNQPEAKRVRPPLAAQPVP